MRLLDRLLLPVFVELIFACDEEVGANLVSAGKETVRGRMSFEVMNSGQNVTGRGVTE